VGHVPWGGRMAGYGEVLLPGSQLELSLSLQQPRCPIQMRNSAGWLSLVQSSELLSNTGTTVVGVVFTPLLQFAPTLRENFSTRSKFRTMLSKNVSFLKLSQHT